MWFLSLILGVHLLTKSKIIILFHKENSESILVKLENSLMVHWLSSLTSTAGFHVRSLCRKLRPWKLHHVVKKKKKKEKN